MAVCDSRQRPQAIDGDLDQASHGGLGRQDARGIQRVEAVGGELDRGHVVADVARRRGFGDQPLDEADQMGEFALRAGDGTITPPAVIGADETAYLDASALPPLAVDRTYQLWGAIGDRRVSLGVLGADPGIIPFDPRLFTAFAITDEEAGGVIQSTRGAVVEGAV